MLNNFAFCSVSISPVRENPADSSEMTSQLIFGEIIEILEIDRQWRKVKSTLDQYSGWMDVKCLTFLTESQMNAWKKEQIILYNPMISLGSAEGTIHLTKGAFVSKERAEFTIGGNEYKMTGRKMIMPTSINDVAKSYLNAPYLWGGKTLFGIDCSGFTQMVYRFMNIAIPRDASIQAKKGDEVDYSKRKEGDLAFFKNEKGNIHHVGVVLKENQIIHAHGWMRIDELDKKGIRGRVDDQYSHKLAFIKRLV
jgi:hypothetical protein